MTLLPRVEGLPTAATTTPSSGPRTVWAEDVRADARGRGQHGQRRHLLAGRCSSRERASTTSAGSTRCWTCCTGRRRRGPGDPDGLAAALVHHARTRRSLPVTADGPAIWPGGRQHVLPGSPGLPRARRAARRGRSPTATRDHPALAMWHVNNEYGCHVEPATATVARPRSGAGCAPVRRRSTRSTRPGGRAFWSQRYGDWSRRSLPPRYARRSPTPRQQLDYARFSSDELLGLLPGRARGAAAGHAGRPDHDELHGRASARSTTGPGRRTWTSSPTTTTPIRPTPDAAARSRFSRRPHALAARRAAVDADGAGHGAVNWRPRNAPSAPGRCGCGARRRSRTAPTRHVLPVAAVRAAAREVPLGDGPARRPDRARGARSRARAALAALAGLPAGRRPMSPFVFDWENWWAIGGDDHPSQLLDLIQLVLDWYRQLYQANVAVEFAHPNADLGDYRLVVAPNLYLLSDDSLAALQAFASNGGVLAVGCFSCVVDERDHVRSGDVTKLAGARVDEFWPPRSRRACRRALPLRRGGHGTRLERVAGAGWR